MEAASGDGDCDVPLRPKYATFINHTATVQMSDSWPGMRTSSRVALEVEFERQLWTLTVPGLWLVYFLFFIFWGSD